MMDDKRLQEIKARAEAVAKDLRDLLPEQVDYASLVCAEGFAHGYHYVWTEPEPYAMEAGAKVIDDLLAEVRRLRAENTRLRAELEAAKRDISSMLQAESYEELCRFCKSVRDEACFLGNCLNADWRGLCAENGGANG